MEFVQYNGYSVSTVDTNGMVFSNIHNVDYVAMRFQLTDLILMPLIVTFSINLLLL